MKLYEFEGKQLLKEAGIPVPESYLIESPNQLKQTKNEIVIKAQTMAGGRGKAGFIICVKSKIEAEIEVNKILGSKHKEEVIKKILIEEKVNAKKEYYLSIIYNTKSRKPNIIISKYGGIDVEEMRKINPNDFIIEEINILEQINEHEIAKKAELPQLAPIIKQCYELFMNKDMKLLEINPLIETQSNEIVAADAVIILDDDAFFRQNYNFPPRIGTGREKTEREIAANNISNMDHRGIAGKTFIDLDGDIAVLASGGGASITAVDALLSYNAKPANYTEYSGNPSPEKVEALTRLVLDIPNLKGLFVVGAKANFTNIKETIEAILKVIKEKKPKYPIVFRRAGPGDKEAKAMVEEAGYEWYGQETPITVAAKIMADKVREYKNDK